MRAIVRVIALGTKILPGLNEYDEVLPHVVRLDGA